MNAEQRRAWSIVGSMFITVAVIWGLGYDIVGVFYHPLSSEFGGSHAQFSLLSTAFSISFLLGGLVVGWLLDRVAAQVVISAGALVVIAGLIIASRTTAFDGLLEGYFLIGLGNSAAVLPAGLLINNWFDRGRGLAMGVALCGLPVGEMTMAWTASYVIASYGWRTAYVVLAILVLALVIPLDLVIVRTRPAGSGPKQSVAQSARALPGLEVTQALRTRAFYLLALIYFFYGLAVSVALVHEVIYLQGIGYSPAEAGKIWGLLLGSTVLTRALMGYLADRISNRSALILSFVVYALGMIASIGSRELVWFVLFSISFAFTMGAPAVILPVFLSEMLGLKRYGTFLGLTNACASVGLAVGPVIAGRIFDLTRSYTGAFEAAAVASVIAAAATILAVAPPVQAPIAAETPSSLSEALTHHQTP